MNPLVELKSLTEIFPEQQPLIAKADHVASALTPEPYKKMLVHEHHMTVTMEQYHHCKVEVRVIERKELDGLYCRKILLLKEGTEEVVQFGIVRLNFEYVTAAVRDEIVSEQIPLGRVLINHNVLRHVDLGAILRIEAGPGLARYLDMRERDVTYGRLATIFCNHQPAIDLLEISAPLDDHNPPRS
ncbi:MAG TPA: hypothetical protein VLA12_08930 [Planctomycetaceae bacterium]|nr:hypothetical protein [Planctomycetaceae bacterium]